MSLFLFGECNEPSRSKRDRDLTSAKGINDLDNKAGDHRRPRRRCCYTLKVGKALACFKRVDRGVSADIDKLVGVGPTRLGNFQNQSRDLLIQLQFELVPVFGKMTPAMAVRA